jgi:hypothetical protein
MAGKIALSEVEEPTVPALRSSVGLGEEGSSSRGHYKYDLKIYYLDVNYPIYSELAESIVLGMHLSVYR